MDKLSGLKIAMCQMRIVPGRPDLNADYMIREIYLAAKRNIDVIVFPEMSVPGYLIGDLWEDDAFIADVQRLNKNICDAAKDAGVTTIFGTALTDRIANKGEDGRLRKYNGALIANQEVVDFVIKTLQPNYRIFDDDRHFYSGRKAYPEGPPFGPIEINVGVGRIKIGVILCEDMWHEDYPLNPTEQLVKNGAEVVFNLSASPWTWQKNRKRHKIIKGLLEKNLVPFVYVNNTGIQNTGKNIVIFDGSSTIYDEKGEIVFEIPPYAIGAHDFTFGDDKKTINAVEGNDTKELYLALKCAIEEFIMTFPPQKRKIVIGLSGGIDSALSATLFVDVLGKENVVTVNMPSEYNSKATQDIAKDIAGNLGVKYEVVPIDEIAMVIAKAANVEIGTMAYENIQARVRMEILAAKAQSIGGMFSCNSNKVEMALGYGTLYGDVAGFLAVLGDLVKREIYQLADYMNREVHKREVVPQSCMMMKPTAELKKNQQDPFDYGHINRRGYHDEMVRAFVEFRRNPEWFLERYTQGKLEEDLMFEKGMLNKLFNSANDFIKDLEQNWIRFYSSYFKRNQSAPIPIVSKRAFGTDCREAMLPAYFTERYYDLKRFTLARQNIDAIKKKEKIAIYGGSFNPPGKHHRQIVERLAREFDKVIIFPCGPRKDKASVSEVELAHRKNLIQLAFTGIEKTEIDFHDLDEGIFTPAYKLDERYKKTFPDAQIWHVVGGDIVAGGRDRNSQIHKVWEKAEEIWQNLNFLVIIRPGYEMENKDLPPSVRVIEIKDIYGSGTMIRNLAKEDKPFGHLTCKEVEEYIKNNELYRK